MAIHVRNLKYICVYCISRVFYFSVFCFLGPHLQHRGVPRLWVESELQLLITATAMRYPSHVYDLHQSSRQCRISDPFSEARDQPCILVDTSQICFHCATTGTPWVCYFSYHTLPPSINPMVLWGDQSWHRHLSWVPLTEPCSGPHTHFSHPSLHTPFCSELL